jgi:hypothetical protein
MPYGRGSDPNRDRKGVPMALRAAKGDEDALDGST